MILSVSRYARKNQDEKSVSHLFASGRKNKDGEYTMDLHAENEPAPEAFEDDKGIM